jgi:hypothetical protein
MELQLMAQNIFMWPTQETIESGVSTYQLELSPPWLDQAKLNLLTEIVQLLCSMSQLVLLLVQMEMSS